MDAYTLKHLIAWIDRQFGPDQSEMLAAMCEQYDCDPDLYEGAGWWRCHDDMVRDGRTML